MLSYISATIEADLVARIVQGDQHAFEQLYDQSNGLLYSLALRMLGDREEAAELLQQVYLEAWRTAARYDKSRGSPIAWLVTLTRSRAIDRRRAQTTRGYGMTDSFHETPAVERQTDHRTPLETVAHRELRILVEKAFAELPDSQRQALELAYYDGLSHSEIASRLNQPVGTIKTRIRLGLSKLKTDLHFCWDKD